MSPQSPKPDPPPVLPEQVSADDDLQAEIQSLLSLEESRRADAILASTRAAALIRAMPEQDFFITLKEVGPDDAVALLGLASPAQWQYLLDIELWRKDRVSVPQMERWLRTLVACGWDCVYRFLITVDPDLLILIFKKEISVFLREDEGPPPPEEVGPLWSLDGIYDVAFKNPKVREIFQTMLQILAEEDFERYRNLLEEVQWRTEPEIEEDAYRFRSARMEDHGFLPLEESISVYHYQPPERVKSLQSSKDAGARWIQPGATAASPRLPVIFLSGGDLISSALREIPDPGSLERIKMELAVLGNQILVADLLEMTGKETLLEVLEKARSYMTIGLQHLGAKDAREAASLLARLPLKSIFRAGYSVLLERAWRAGRIWRRHWATPKQLRRSLLGSPWHELLDGLDRPRPKILDPVSQQYRDPASLEELQQLDAELDRMAVAGDFLQIILEEVGPEALRKTVQASVHGELEMIDWRNLLLTAFAGWTLRGEVRLRPLAQADLRRFHRLAWLKSHPLRLRKSLRKGWLRALCQEGRWASGKCEALIHKILDDLEEEIRGVSLEDLDPRFLPFVTLKD